MIFEARDVSGGYSAADMILKGVTVTADAGEITLDGRPVAVYWTLRLHFGR